MEIRIGVQNVAREIVLETEESADRVRATVEKSMTENTPLILTDSRGHTVTVHAEALGYVEVGAETKGRVGFGG